VGEFFFYKYGGLKKSYEEEIMASTEKFLGNWKKKSTQLCPNDENPHRVTEEVLKVARVIVWTWIWAEGLIGPFFIEGT